MALVFQEIFGPCYCSGSAEKLQFEQQGPPVKLPVQSQRTPPAQLTCRKGGLCVRSKQLLSGVCLFQPESTGVVSCSKSWLWC
jgi:hypothetical protein